MTGREPCPVFLAGDLCKVTRRPATAASGPMEGDWIVESCVFCNAFGLQTADGGNGADNVLAALEAQGCNPRPRGQA